MNVNTMMTREEVMGTVRRLVDLRVQQMQIAQEEEALLRRLVDVHEPPIHAARTTHAARTERGAPGDAPDALRTRTANPLSSLLSSRVGPRNRLPKVLTLVLAKDPGKFKAADVSRITGCTMAAAHNVLSYAYHRDLIKRVDIGTYAFKKAKKA